MMLRYSAALLLSTVLLAQPSLPEKARQVVDLLLQEKYAELTQLFTPEMKQNLSEETLRTSVRPRFQALGAVQKVLDPEVQRGLVRDIVIVPVQFAQAAVNIQVSFTKTGEVAGLFFRPRVAPAGPYQPPPYSKPDQFRTEEVTIGKGEWQLPGTLSIPVGKGPFAAVVLVHGSGPNDRDETVGGNRPFRDLAEGLASRGIAVLRYDKRTRVHAAKMTVLDDLTVQQETIEDALAAAALLRSRPEINPARVCVLGHSLGGYLVPRIARQDPKLAGLVVMAGNTRPLEDLILEQTTYIFSLRGTPTQEQQRQLEELKQAVQRVKTLKPGMKVPVKDLPLGVPVSYWLDLQDYDPAAEARNLKMPMLILQGERDYQVTMTDFARWKEALKDRGTVTLRSYPALNHLFQPGEGKSTPTEYLKPGHIAPEVINDLANWLAAL
jgi:dienelactone hydrolase